MTAPAKHLALLGLAGLALLAMPATAAARCVEPAPIGQAVATADAVIVGTAVTTEQEGTVANVLVTEIWRGPDLPPNVRVWGGPGGGRSSIDRTFEAGTRYLFTLTLDVDGSLHDSACSSTTPWDATLEALRPAAIRSPLGAIDAATDAAPADAPFDPASLVAPVGVALFVAVALLGIGLLARGRQGG